MKPLISVLIANHNNERFIEFAISSVINQSFNDWELIIVDDSSDSSPYIIKKFLNDSRIKLSESCLRLNLIESRIRTVMLASADILVILDGDDMLENNALDIIYKTHLEGHRFVYSQKTIFNEDMSKKWPGGNKKIPDGLTNLHADSISHLVSFRKDDYLKTSGYDKIFFWGAEDKDLFYKLEEISQPYFIDIPLYRYRINAYSSGANSRFYRKIRNRILYAVAKFKAYRRRQKNKNIKNITLSQLVLWLLRSFLPK
jgi:glycosyltransferase involved in cell wall biosynthesis